jgi:hypothetical protein
MPFQLEQHNRKARKPVSIVAKRSDGHGAAIGTNPDLQIGDASTSSQSYRYF